MSTETDPDALGKLSAWERWEMASFEDARPQEKSIKAATKQAPVAALEPPTAEEIAEIHEQARKSGYAAGHTEGLTEGRAQGHAAGYAEGMEKARAEGQRLATLAVQLDSALAGVEQQVADDLLALALEVAKQVVRQAIAVKPELVLAVVREALAQMHHQHVSIYLHPDDASLVRSYLGDQLGHAGHRILEDGRVELGGCMVEAGGSQLDATMATRWRRMVENLGTNNEWLET